MANEILVKQGTQLVYANAGDYGNSPIADTDQIQLTSLGVGLAREGDKGDLTIKFARRHAVTMRIEFVTDPVVGESVDLYWGASLAAAAGTANPGNLTGVDAAYAGSVGSTLAETLLQLQFLGSLICTLDNEPVVQQVTFIVEFPTRYGIPVVVNNTSDLFEDDGVEMSITITPLVDEIQ